MSSAAASAQAAAASIDVQLCGPIGQAVSAEYQPARAITESDGRAVVASISGEGCMLATTSSPASGIAAHSAAAFASQSRYGAGCTASMAARSAAGGAVTSNPIALQPARRERARAGTSKLLRTWPR